VARVVTDQQTLAGAAAEALAASADGAYYILLKALSTNAGTLYVGDSSVSSAEGYPLVPGEAVSLPVPSVDGIYIRGTAADKSAVIAFFTE
jgi:hypothetical protein